MFNFEDAFKLIPEQTIVCVGDLMLDDFVYGEVSRISPEAPAPILADLSAHRAIDHARRHHPIPTQAGYEGKGLPVSLRYAANQSLAARAPAAQPDHFRIGRGLVDEHQSGRIKHGLPSLPASTCPGHVRAILLRGAQAFF